MNATAPARTDWSRVASRFFAVMIGLATVYALVNSPSPEALLLALTVVLPIAWITLRDAQYSRVVWSVAATVPIVVWLVRAVIG